MRGEVANFSQTQVGESRETSAKARLIELGSVLTLSNRADFKLTKDVKSFRNKKEALWEIPWP